MLPKAILSKRLRTLIMARLFIAAFFLFHAQFVFPAEKILFYAIIALISVLSAIYMAWLITARNLLLLAYVQMVCDLVLESALVYFTGGVDSIFANVYMISILTAGAVLSPRASFAVALGSSVCFAVSVYLNNAFWAPSDLVATDTFSNGRRDVVYLFYAGYVRITVFFLVAILTYYFSQMIQTLEGKMKTQERLVFLGEVVSSIAHEIRNPLASISGSVELISRRLGEELSEKQRKLMSAVVEESERINRIFSRLLDYSRLPELKLEEVSVTGFLDQIFLLMRHQESFNPRVKVVPSYKERNLKIRIDPEYMKQVLINVITNAYEAMPDEGKLTVDAHANGTHVLISVEDTGCGMDRKTLHSVFIPFKTTKSNGTGLGLAHAYKIVSQHGGQLSISSKQQKGTQVKIALPKL
ncbi:MAG: GHKL domain-containing protein [Candidatus Omnitrophica bacterium]|nr:GHKL domain-containing protein [Candidatus Omnitrophota bacterium]